MGNESSKVIAGALVDFTAWLTTRENEITTGAKHHPSKIIDVLEEWAKMRGLSLEDADVSNWEEAIR